MTQKAVLFLAGTLISYGLWLAWKPLGPIAGGLMLVAGSIARDAIVEMMSRGDR